MGRVFFVTRHAGAITWLRQHAAATLAGVQPIWLSHLEGHTFAPGDKVCGVLSLALAARICAAGAEVHVLTHDTPEHLRGRELSAEEMQALGARLVRYEVREMGEIGAAECSPIGGCGHA